MFGKFDRIVRCKDGHLFETIWVPLASLKAVRLGNRRFQHCPVAHHWSTVRPVDAVSLTPDELITARSIHDLRVP
jgi:hypothetical protein